MAIRMLVARSILQRKLMMTHHADTNFVAACIAMSTFSDVEHGRCQLTAARNTGLVTAPEALHVCMAAVPSLDVTQNLGRSKSAKFTQET